ncbi:aminotransferase class V-fold PLP-dependent enzyme [Streptomyces sp. 4.24]|uniref:aminotransferase class V-fold PLP-dependent enzyme n=1 Tax=Streptomyces tritrimontium TaxID=3406573 RepID=UPI003BB6DECC
MPMAVLGRDIHVPLATGGAAPYAALDYAASAPVLQRVWDDVAAFAPYYGSVHRGAGHLSRVSTDLFEDSRDEVAAFLGCREDDHVVFTRSTTDSLNLLASALPYGTRVFVFETEHHAALLPWQRRADSEVVYLTAPHSAREAVETLDRVLAQMSRGPALVCVTGASNVTGELWPVQELVEVACRHGARTVVDAAQMAPHRAVDLAGWGADWVAFSGHKLYAPFGAGVLAGRADWLQAAQPYLAGGGASRRVSRQADGRMAVEWHSDSARHEAGSPNVIGVYAMAAACRALNTVGFERITAHEQHLTARVTSALKEIPQARMLSLFGDGAPRIGVVSFHVDGWDSSRLASALSAEYGIGVRDGLFCAHPLLRSLLGTGPSAEAECGALGSSPEGSSLNAVRVSFGVGTPVEHIDRFVDALRDLVRRGDDGRPATRAPWPRLPEPASTAHRVPASPCDHSPRTPLECPCRCHPW